MAAILSRPQCVNSSWPSVAHMRHVNKSLRNNVIGMRYVTKLCHTVDETSLGIMSPVSIQTPAFQVLGILCQ